jgi:hypothetical protein
LETAFMHGYQNFNNVKKDPDLENARKQAAFKPLVKQFEKKPRTASREVLGEMVSMCDTCAAVLASTSTEAEKQATGKNVCEQCLKNRAVVKAKLPDGSAMRLCSECAQSISPAAATAAAGDSVRHSGEQTPLNRGPSNPTLGVPGGAGPPPVAPRRPSAPQAGFGGGDDDDGPPPPGPDDDDEPQPPAAAASGEHAPLGNGDGSSDPPSNGGSGVHDDDVPPPEHVEDDEPHEPAAPVVPAGPRRPVGAVAIMPGMPANFAPLRARPGGAAPPRGGAPGPAAPARRMVAQRGAPPVASRGAPPPGADGRGPPPATPGNGAAPAPGRGPPTPSPRGGGAPPVAARAGAGGAPPPAARRSLPQPARGAPAAAPLSGSAEGDAPPSDDGSADAAPAAAAPAAAAAAAPAADGELPAGWKEFVDKKTGRKYYHAAATKETVWVRPTQPVAGAAAAAAAPAAAATATAAAANEPLPAGWQEFTDKKTTRKYYYCASTKETVWVRPGPEKAVAGASPVVAKPAAAATPAPAAAAAAAAAPAAVAAAAAPAAAAAAAPAAAKPAAGGALAPGWVEYMDKKRGLPYYYNKTTKETVWVRPVADEPDSNGIDMSNVTTITAAAAAIDSDDEDGLPPAQPLDDDDSDDLPTIEAGAAVAVDEFDE